MYIDDSSRRPVMRSSGGHLFTDPKRTPKRVISKTFKNHQTSAFKSLKPFKNENSMFKQEIAMLSCFSFLPFHLKQMASSAFQNLADLVELEALNTPASNNKVGDRRNSEKHRWMVFQKRTLYGILGDIEYMFL